MNLSETNPIVALDRLTAIETAVGLDETALFGTGAGSSVDVTTTALTAPRGSVVTNAGTAGSTSYSYLVAAVGNGGSRTPDSAASTTTGNATLSTTNYNVITWVSVPGYVYYIYRTASSGTPSGTGYVGTATATSTSTNFHDTGITETAAVTPASDSTGALFPAGPVVPAQPVFIWTNVQSLSTDGNATLTVANIVNRVLVRTGTATPTDTLPTAASLVAAFPGVKANNGFIFNYRNRATATATLQAGSGGSSATGNTLTVATTKAKDFLVHITNVTPASEAYVLYALGVDSAF